MVSRVTPIAVKGVRSIVMSPKHVISYDFLLSIFYAQEVTEPNYSHANPPMHSRQSMLAGVADLAGWLHAWR